MFERKLTILGKKIEELLFDKSELGKKLVVMTNDRDRVKKEVGKKENGL